MTCGLLEEEQDTPNSAHSVAPKVTHSLQDTQRRPFVRDAFKYNKSPLLGIAPLAMPSYRPAITIFTSISASVESSSPSNSSSDRMGQFRVIQSRPPQKRALLVGHWARWCIIPFTVAWVILRPSNLFQCLSDLAVVSPRYNAICTITVAAFRRLLRQEGAFFHQTPNDTKPICWWIDTLLSAVSQDAPQELEVPFFRSISMPSRCKINTDALALTKVLPVDIDAMHLPPIVCSLQQDGCPGEQVATLSIESIWCAALRELQQRPPELEQNVSLQITQCNCGEYHVQVVLVKPCVAGDILVPGTFGDPKIFVQFDGSAYHDLHIGGAGAGLFEISAQGLQLLDWGCLALPVCKDNIVAEVMGADLKLFGCTIDTSILVIKMVPLPLSLTRSRNHLSITSSFMVGFAGLISPISLISFIKEEAELPPCLQLSIDLERLISLLIIWLAKVVPTSC